jgi:hypothetical protein
MVEKISMTVDETLELDYLVEDISNDTINVKDEPSNFSTEIGYIRKEIGVFDPPGAGTYQLEINEQTIEIEVTDIPDSGDLQHHYIAGGETYNHGDEITTYTDQEGTLDLSDLGDPKYQTNVINGEPVSRYDGTDDAHQNSSSSISQPLHIFVVGKLNTLSNGNNQQFTGGTVQVQYDNSADAWGLFAGSAISGGSPDTNFHIFTAKFDGANSYLRVDGTQLVSGDAGTNRFSDLHLGANKAPNQWLNGDIAEVPIHGSVLSSSAESDWETYLSDKYGISI